MKAVVAACLAAVLPVAADDDSFRERFADPETREAALEELIPGTRDAYFHTALAHQLAGRSKEFQSTMDAWRAAAERKEHPVAANGLRTLENRQLLLDYKTSPDASLAELIRRLDLDLTATRPDAEADAALPTRLDPALVSEEAFERAAERDNPGQPYASYDWPRAHRELARVAEFDAAKIRSFPGHFGQLSNAQIPGVVELVARGLALEPPVLFGSETLHDLLTAGQLDELLKLSPGVAGNEKFVMAWLQKHRPGAETDFRVDPAAHARHLEVCRELAHRLPPALNSIKAHVLFHHLRLQADAGSFPKQDFIAYLKLPRTRHPLLKCDPKRPREHPVDLAANLDEATGCPPVADDRALIESYLYHFLGASDSAKDFAPYLPEGALANIHARARLLAGGDPARWGVALDPAEFRALQQETRVGFGRGAPRLLDADAAATLHLTLKNTPELLLRIYEIDLPAHLAREGAEPAVDMDIDGFVPHFERRLRFDHAPLLAHEERIELPEISGVGAWLVDVVSGGVAARALIRKGRLVVWPERTATGQTLRVFDERANPVPTATLALGTETFAADPSGVITIPNSASHRIRSGILTAGKLATAIEIESREDELALEAKFHLDREQLLADCPTTLQLRARLLNHGCELPLDGLRDASLILRGELAGGVTTERVIAGDLALRPAMEIPFQVPEGLRSLTLVLRAVATPPGGGEPVPLTSQATYRLNADLGSTRIGTALFAPTAAGHRLELRGRNGEPLPSRAITLTANRRGYLSEVDVTLRSDDQGIVELGALDGFGILEVKGDDWGGGARDLLTGDPFADAGGSGKNSIWYFPGLTDGILSSSFRITRAGVVRIPLLRPTAAPDRLLHSLVEVANISGVRRPVRDFFDKLSVEDGHLVIRGLPPGRFALDVARQGGSVDIQVSAGVARDGLLVSPVSILPAANPPQPFIAEATVGDKEIVIRIGGGDPATRVSMVGKRYDHKRWRPGDGLLPFGQEPLPALRPGFPECAYLTEKTLDSETRYILDRRADKVFPGSMLPRPGLLLHRWKGESLGQMTVDGDYGRKGRSVGGQSDAFGDEDRSSGDASSGPRTESATVCDFLRQPAVVRFDLPVPADGVLRLPRADFAHCQLLEITAASPHAGASRILPLPPTAPPVRDRRLARPLDPAIHYHATRGAVGLAQGATAVIENPPDADWRAVGTLAEAHQLLFGTTPGTALAEFAFLTEWPALAEERKLELLAAHPCHELHLFLARKDKPFFDRYVKPLLARKPAPGVIDDILLERDLTPWLRPFAWRRLNAAEKALLARAVPAARQRIAKELNLRWETEAPPPEEEAMLFTETLRGASLDVIDSLGLVRRELRRAEEESETMASGADMIGEKLRRIIIPSIDFEDVSVEEAIDFLQNRTRELDTLETDPARKGIDFVVRAGLPRIKELRLNNVPVGAALKYICDSANPKVRYATDQFAVTVLPFSAPARDLLTRVFRVSPSFHRNLAGAEGTGGPERDPFADEPADLPADSSLPPIKDLLARAGIGFGPGASASLSRGLLIVVNTSGELDKIEQLTESLTGMESPTDSALSAGFADADGDDGSPPELPNAVGAVRDENPFGADFPTSPAIRLKPVLPTADKTHLWLEANYYAHNGNTGEDFIPLNRFWLDLAAWDGKGPFLSPHFNTCTHNANDALLCLALLDLPFKAERPEAAIEDGSLRVKAREPMLLYFRDIRRAEAAEADAPLLVRQVFRPLGEPLRHEGSETVETAITGGFRTGVPYSLALTVTNPGGAGRRIEVLAQIPAGAIPLAGRPATLAETHRLKPYGVLSLELAFYFPQPGEFTAYPLHVSAGGVVLAHTEARTLRVATRADAGDPASWSALAADGATAAVLERLRTANLDRTDLSLICWRLTDREVFREVTAILRERLHHSPAVAAYGFLHNDPAAIREYLENSAAIRQLGSWLDSPLLTVRPRQHLDWELAEFDPLVNPRAHRFAGASRLTHEAAREHYHDFLDQLAWKPALDADDHLTLAAFLFLQDRVEEALARFDRVDPARLPGRLQYDYFRAVALWYRERPDEARAVAVANLPGLPPGLWRDRFQAVIDQADELAVLTKHATAGGPPPAAAAPGVELAMAGPKRLLVKHRGLESLHLHLFSVDLETLFSKDPFFTDGAGAAPSIRPNETLAVPLAADRGETLVDLPPALGRGNLLVSATGGPVKLLKVMDSTAIDLRRLPATSILQNLDAGSGLPLAKTYVKVYAETTAGAVVFHKDGYTDPRGMFDFLAHTGVDPASIRRLAILVCHPANGARTVVWSP